MVAFLLLCCCLPVILSQHTPLAGPHAPQLTVSRGFQAAAQAQRGARPLPNRTARWRVLITGVCVCCV